MIGILISSFRFLLMLKKSWIHSELLLN